MAKNPLEVVDEITKRFKDVIPGDVFKKSVQEQLAQVAKTANVKGFRPGKVPVHVVEVTHGKQVRQEAAYRLIDTCIKELIDESKLRAVEIANVDMNEESLGGGEDIPFTVDIVVEPEPTITGYEGVEVEQKTKDISDKDIDEVIERILTSRATLAPISGRTVAEKGDVVTFQVVTTVEGQEPSRPEPVTGALDGAEIAEKFQNVIVGASIGDTVTVEDAIPETHQDASMRGKNVSYALTIEALQTRVLPELTDDLVKQLDNTDVETVLELRVETKERLEQEVLRRSLTTVKADLMQKVIEANKFQVPQAMIDSEIRSMLVRAGAVDTSKMHPSQVNVAPFRAQVGPMAESQVRSGIIVRQVADQEKIEVSDEELDEKLKEIATDAEVTVDEVKKYYDTDEAKSMLREEVRGGKVLDLFLSKAKVTKVAEEEEAAPEAQAAGK